MLADACGRGLGGGTDGQPAWSTVTGLEALDCLPL
jgi:hypothetical protein